MADASTYSSSRDYTKTITILVGQTTSEAFDTYGASLVGFITDANLTGTTFTFEGSPTGGAGTFLPYYTNDSAGDQKQVSIGVSTNKIFTFDSRDFASLQYIKFVSATQATNPTVITLILRGTPA